MEARAVAVKMMNEDGGDQVVQRPELVVTMMTVTQIVRSTYLCQLFRRHDVGLNTDRYLNKLSLNSREQFPRNILEANVTRTSLTCSAEIGRVTMMLRNCYEETDSVKLGFRLLITPSRVVVLSTARTKGFFSF